MLDYIILRIKLWRMRRFQRKAAAWFADPKNHGLAHPKYRYVKEGGADVPHTRAWFRRRAIARVTGWEALRKRLHASYSARAIIERQIEMGMRSADGGLRGPRGIVGDIVEADRGLWLRCVPDDGKSKPWSSTWWVRECFHIPRRKKDE